MYRWDWMTQMPVPDMLIQSHAEAIGRGLPTRSQTSKGKADLDTTNHLPHLLSLVSHLRLEVQPLKLISAFGILRIDGGFQPLDELFGQGLNRFFSLRGAFESIFSRRGQKSLSLGRLPYLNRILGHP